MAPQLAVLWWYLAAEGYPAWRLQREFLPCGQVRRGLGGWDTWAFSLISLNLGLSLGLAEGGEFQKAMRLLMISAWTGRQEGLLISASCAVIPESWSLHAAECQNWTKPDASYRLASRALSTPHAGSGASEESLPPLQQPRKVGMHITIEVGGD